MTRWMMVVAVTATGCAFTYEPGEGFHPFGSDDADAPTETVDQDQDGWNTTDPMDGYGLQGQGLIEGTLYTVDPEPFSGAGMIERWGDGNYTEIFAQTTTSDGKTGMFIVSGEAPFHNLFINEGTWDLDPNRNFAQLCGGDEDEDDWYDEEAEDLRVVTHDLGDGTYEVTITGRNTNGGTERWQAMSFRWDGNQMLPLDQY